MDKAEFNSETKPEKDLTEIEEEIRSMTLTAIMTRVKVAKLKLQLSLAYSHQFRAKVADRVDALKEGSLFQKKEVILMTEDEVLEKLDDYVLS